MSSETDSAPPDDLPDERLRALFDGKVVHASSEFDVDDDLKFTRALVAHVDDELWLIDLPKQGEPTVRSRASVERVAKVETVEGIGLDRMDVLGATGEPVLQARYSHRRRRDMSRFKRKLSRRLKLDVDASDDESDDAAWLARVEADAERNERCKRCNEPVPAWADGVCPRCLQKRAILWRLLDVAKPYRAKTITALVLTIAFSGLATLPPIFTKYLIDTALEPKGAGGVDLALEQSTRIENLAMYAVALVGAIVVMEIISGVRLTLLAGVGCSITRDLRDSVYKHMHQLSLGFFSKRRTGSLITRVTSDTDRLWDFIVFGSVNVIRDALMIVVFAVVMLWFNWQLAIVALIPIPVVAVLTYVKSMSMQRQFTRLWGYWSRLTAVVGDALPGVKVVKAFANEDREVSRFTEHSDAFTLREQRVVRTWAGMQPLVSGAMRLGTTLVWVVGGYLLITQPASSNYTVGTLIMFIGFVHMFYQPIMELATSNRMVTRAASSAQRVFEVLDTAPEIFDRAGAIRPERLEGRVEFQNVSFSYDGSKTALRHVNLTVEPGEMIGLCGPSGAGKSTFVNLICRFYDPTDGRLLVDGTDLRDYDVRAFRRQVGMVLQDPYLFHGTIAENIRYGNPRATEREVIRAARAANAHDFITALPDGYDTMVGERGQSLSGGERQRVSIARAICHNPKLLVLDEATSSVDTETEKQIQEALDRLVAGRTTFAIAHRLSTLTAADRLVVFEGGRIAEVGTHRELIDKPDGIYAKLHRTQLELNSVAFV